MANVIRALQITDTLYSIRRSGFDDVLNTFNGSKLLTDDYMIVSVADYMQPIGRRCGYPLYLRIEGSVYSRDDVLKFTDSTDEDLALFSELIDSFDSFDSFDSLEVSDSYIAYFLLSKLDFLPIEAKAFSMEVRTFIAGDFNLYSKIKRVRDVILARSFSAVDESVEMLKSEISSKLGVAV